MTILTLTLFGGFEARTASESPAPVLGKKAQGLLAVLGLRPGQTYTRDRLAALLWGEVEAEQARHSVRQALFSLRRALPAAQDVFVTAGETVAMNPAAIAVDVAEFERLAGDSSPEALEEARRLYRGELLEGLRLREPAFEEWLDAERRRLRSIATTALDRLVTAHVEAGALDRAIDTAVRLVGLDPVREASHRTLIRLYLRTGRRPLALRQYQMLERALGRDLGLKPDAESRRLYEHVVDARRGAPSAGANPGAAVLVVEDEPVSRALLEGFLSPAGYEVTVVGDGAEALVQLNRRRFDLIVSDIAMPTMDGLTLAQVVTRKGLDTPVIFVTGQPGDALEVRGLELGAADYLRKPIQKDVLLLRVRKALKG